MITNQAVRWEQIGKILGVKGLDNIKENCRQSDKFFEKCLEKTLQGWLEIDVNATWNKLENALNQAIQDEAGIAGENVIGMLLLILFKIHRNRDNNSPII